MDYLEGKYLDECSKFRQYADIDEYSEDVVYCLMRLCGYPEKVARRLVEIERKMVKRMYDAEYPAYDLAMDYYPICG